MTTSTSRQLLETREDACSTVQKILHGEAARFEMIPFDKYNRIARLRSPHFNSYSVLCHSSTTRSAGWLVCRYILNGGCQLEKGLYAFKIVQDCTSRLERHTNSHKNGPVSACFQRLLPLAARNRVTNAAAHAIAVDMQPLSFCDGHAGIRSFAKTIFELGQSVPAN